MNPAIVVQAYNRPAALRRLLASLARAAYPDGVRLPLVISVDRGPDARNAEVVQAAREFAWPHGPQEIIHHPQRRGMLEHLFFCGSLTEKYGAIIFLEDDLAVAPVFYYYATQALEYFDGDPQIGGLSLYALWFNGYTQHPFVPLSDDSDVFFLQIPYTQGQAWTAAQWARFTAWRAQNARRLRPTSADTLHELWLHFGPEEWFPIMTKYLVETGQFYAFPRTAQTTGFGDAGAHFAAASAYFQAPLQRAQTAYHFRPLADSNCVYDSFFEILPDRLQRLAPGLTAYDFGLDLNATKEPRHLRRAPYVLTTRPARRAERTFGLRMWPMEANLIEGVPGNEIALCRAEDVRRDWWSGLLARRQNHLYFTRGRRTSRRRQLQFALVDWVGRLRRALGRRSDER